MPLTTLYAINLLDAFGMAIILPLVNSRIGALGGSLMWVGMTASATAGAQLFGSPIVGSWSDTRGRKTLLMYTLALTLFSNALVGIPSLVIFFISRVLYGLSHQTDVLVRTMISDKLPPDQVGKSFNRLSSILGLAFMLGPLAGGILYEKFQSYYFISILLCTVTTFLMSLVYLTLEETMKIDPKVTKEPKKAQSFSASLLEDLGKVFANLKNISWEKYGDLLMMKFLSESVFNMLFMNMGVVLVTIFSFKQIHIGYVISFMSTVMIPFSVSMSYIFKTFYQGDKSGSKRAFHAFSVLIVTICLLPLATRTTSVLYIALITTGVLVKIMADSVVLEILSGRTTEKDKGVTMGANTSMQSLAGLICPLISGAVGSTLGLTPLLLLPIVPALAGISLIGYLKKTRVVIVNKKKDS